MTTTTTAPPSTTTTTTCPSGAPTLAVKNFTAEYVAPGAIPYPYWKTAADLSVTNTTPHIIQLDGGYFYALLEDGRTAPGRLDFYHQKRLQPGETIEWTETNNWNDDGRIVAARVREFRWFFWSVPASCSPTEQPLSYN